MLFGLNFDVVDTAPVRQTDPVEAVKAGRVPADKIGSNDAQKSPLTQNDSVELSEKAQEESKAFKAESELSEEERKQVEELKRTDRAVRQHEQAHKSIGGQHVLGGANYEYKKGPDGQLYAVGGEVKIDVSEVANDPEATIEKMQQIRRAALAPSDPSPQDRRVAAEATRKENRARAELSREQIQNAVQEIENPGESNPADRLPGKSSAIFQIKDAESYRVDPPENLFELFA